MFPVATGAVNEPFFMSVDDVFHLADRKGTTLVGLIESGVITALDLVGCAVVVRS